MWNGVPQALGAHGSSTGRAQTRRPPCNLARQRAKITLQLQQSGNVWGALAIRPEGRPTGHRARMQRSKHPGLEMIPTVIEADVELVFDPPWNRSMMSEVARLETGMF